jgi:hypothetical protein
MLSSGVDLAHQGTVCGIGLRSVAGLDSPISRGRMSSVRSAIYPSSRGGDEQLGGALPADESLRVHDPLVAKGPGMSMPSEY